MGCRRRSGALSAHDIKSAPVPILSSVSSQLWFRFTCYSTESLGSPISIPLESVTNDTWSYFKETLNKTTDRIEDKTRRPNKSYVLYVRYAGLNYKIEMETHNIDVGKFNGVIKFVDPKTREGIDLNFANIVLDGIRSVPGTSDVGKGMYYPYAWNATFASDNFRVDTLDSSALPRLTDSTLTGNLLVDCLIQSKCKINDGRVTSSNKLHMSISHRGDWMYVDVERDKIAQNTWKLDVILMKGLPRKRPIYQNLIEHINESLATDAGVRNVIWQTPIDFENAWDTRPTDLP